MDTMDALNRACRLLGSDAALAKQIGTTGAAIAMMRKRHRVSAESAVAIEHATSGRVLRGELRPDLFAQTDR